MNESRAVSPALGAWRFVLALLVVNGHLNDDWWAATWAVFSFYVLSGYLITMIVNRTYGFTLRGFTSFLANRVLRIHPPYYAAVGLSLVVLAVLPGSFLGGYNTAIRLPETGYDLVSNAAILGLYMGQPSRLVPAAWALHIELCHYVAIAVLLGRSGFIAAAWLVASAAYYIQYPPKLYFVDGYFSVAGSSIAFAVGACVFHAQPHLKSLQAGPASRPFLVAALAAYAAPYAAVKLFGANPMLTAFTANIATSAMLLVALSGPRRIPARLRRLDDWLGDLSYPVYLLHWGAGALVLYGAGVAMHTPAAFWLTAAATLVLAAAEARWLSRPLERLRSRIKQRLESAPIEDLALAMTRPVTLASPVEQPAVAGPD